MNEILELIDAARIEVNCDEYADQVMKNLLILVQAKHKADVIAAYNRGRASMMGVFQQDSEEYYTKTYE